MTDTKEVLAWVAFILGGICTLFTVCLYIYWRIQLAKLEASPDEESDESGTLKPSSNGEQKEPPSSPSQVK